MMPKEYFTLSSVTSVAGAAGIVLVVTNFVAMLYEKGAGQFAAQVRVGLGIFVAAVVAVLAMIVSPPSPGGWATPAVIFLGFANTCLLYVTAFGGSKLSAAGAGQAGNQALLDEKNRLAASVKNRQDIKDVARFWRPW